MANRAVDFVTVRAGGAMVGGGGDGGVGGHFAFVFGVRFMLWLGRGRGLWSGDCGE